MVLPTAPVILVTRLRRPRLSAQRLRDTRAAAARSWENTALQLDTYWAEIKAQSKAITGVEKVKLGLFSGNASGVGSALTTVTKAKKPADAAKAAGKAKAAITDYLIKVHKVEAKKPTLT